MKKRIALLASISMLTFSSCSSEGILCNVQANAEDNVQIDACEAVNFDFEADVGSCKVSYGEENSAYVQLKYNAWGVNNDDAEDIISHISADIYTKNNTIYIRFSEKESGMDFWKWIDKHKSMRSFSVDADITIPEHIKDFSIETDVGNIIAENLCGKFDLSSDVGNVEAKNISIEKSSEFSSDVGNVSVSLSDAVAANSDVDISSDTGNAELELSGKKEDSSKISISSDVGDVSINLNGLDYENNSNKKSVVSEKNTITADDNCEIKLSTDVGKININ